MPGEAQTADEKNEGEWKNGGISDITKVQGLRGTVWRVIARQ